jgi:Putative amidoligase enzyme
MILSSTRLVDSISILCSISDELGPGQVNFTSLAKHSTVEFRQHEGTVSATSAISWVEFIIRFVEYAINASDDAVKTGGETIDDLARLVPLP